MKKWSSYIFSGSQIAQNLSVVLVYSILSRLLVTNIYSEVRYLAFWIDFGVPIVVFGGNISLFRSNLEVLLAQKISAFLNVLLLNSFAFTLAYYLLNGYQFLNSLIVFFAVFISGTNIIFFTTSVILKIKLASFVGFLSLAFTIIQVVVLWFLKHEQNVNFIILMIRIIPSLLIFVLYLFVLRLSFKPKFGLEEINLYKDNYPLAMTIIIGSATIFIDKYISKLNLSNFEFALLSNGNFEIPFIGTLILSNTILALPALREHYESKDFLNFNQLLDYLFTSSLKLIMVVMVVVILNAELIVKILFGTKYVHSAFILQFSSIALLARFTSYTHIITIIDSSKYLIKRMLLELILTILLCYLGSKYFGAIGVVFSSLTILFAFSVPYNLKLINKRTDINIFETQFVRFFLVGLAVVFSTLTSSFLIDNEWLKLTISLILILMIMLKSKVKYFRNLEHRKV